MFMRFSHFTLFKASKTKTSNEVQSLLWIIKAEASTILTETKSHTYHMSLHCVIKSDSQRLKAILQLLLRCIVKLQHIALVLHL